MCLWYLQRHALDVSCCPRDNRASKNKNTENPLDPWIDELSFCCPQAEGR